MLKFLAHSILFLLLAGLVHVIEAKNNNSLAPHIHGEGKLNFVLNIEEQKAELSFKFPAIQVLGFERKPKTDSEKKIFEDTKSMLKVPTNVFSLLSYKNTKSECVFAKSTFKIPYLEEHSHHHHHEHGEDHSDYELNYVFDCKNIKSISGFKIEAFKNLKGLEKIKAEGFVGEKAIVKDLLSKETELLF